MVALLDMFRKKPAGAERLKSYRVEKDDYLARVHLREEPDGSGVMIINAAVVVHVNATAMDIARCILEGRDLDATYARLREKYSEADRSQVEEDFRKVHAVVFPPEKIEDRCPFESLASADAEPFSRKVSAPLRADLALTYGCGNDCSHCYVGRDKDMKSLPLAKWRTVLERLWAAGIPHVCFTGGEATGSPHLVELIEHAEDLGMVAGLLTNGRRLKDKEYVERLVGAGLDHVQITIESHDAEVHDRMVGAKAFAETVEGIKNALAADIHVVTNTTLTTLNAPDVERTIDFLHGLGVGHFACNSIIYSGGGRTSGIGIPEEDLEGVLERVVSRSHEHGMRFIWYSPTQYCRFNPSELDIGHKRCTAGEYNICVEPNGDVLPCQSYFKAAGNILRDPWKSIWESPLFRDFRERLSVPEDCRGCPDFDVCGGGCPLDRENGVLHCGDSTSEG
ncbi:MAG: radical SAM protein [Elusimicrobiota bacterium]